MRFPLLSFHDVPRDCVHAKVHEMIIISLFDEVEFDDRSSGGYLEDETAIRKEKRFLGSVVLPFQASKKSNHTRKLSRETDIRPPLDCLRCLLLRAALSLILSHFGGLLYKLPLVWRVCRRVLSRSVVYLSLLHRGGHCIEVGLLGDTCFQYSSGACGRQLVCFCRQTPVSLDRRAVPREGDQAAQHSPRLQATTTFKPSPCKIRPTCRLLFTQTVYQAGRVEGMLRLCVPTVNLGYDQIHAGGAGIDPVEGPSIMQGQTITAVKMRVAACTRILSLGDQRGMTVPL